MSRSDNPDNGLRSRENITKTLTRRQRGPEGVTAHHQVVPLLPEVLDAYPVRDLGDLVVLRRARVLPLPEQVAVEPPVQVDGRAPALDRVGDRDEHEVQRLLPVLGGDGAAEYHRDAPFRRLDADAVGQLVGGVPL